jgi:hypothetical protein
MELHPIEVMVLILMDIYIYFNYYIFRIRDSGRC